MRAHLIEGRKGVIDVVLTRTESLGSPNFPQTAGRQDGIAPSEISFTDKISAANDKNRISWVN